MQRSTQTRDGNSCRKNTTVNTLLASGPSWPVSLAFLIGGPLNTTPPRGTSWCPNLVWEELFWNWSGAVIVVCVLRGWPHIRQNFCYGVLLSELLLPGLVPFYRDQLSPEILQSNELHMLQNDQLWRDLFQRMHLHHGLPSLHRYQQWSFCQSVQHHSAGQTIEYVHETQQFTQPHTGLLGTALFCICHRYDPLFTVFTFRCNCLINE